MIPKWNALTLHPANEFTLASILSAQSGQPGVRIKGGHAGMDHLERPWFAEISGAVFLGLFTLRLKLLHGQWHLLSKQQDHSSST